MNFFELRNSQALKPLDHIEKSSNRLSIWLLIISILVGLIGLYQIFSILWVLSTDRPTDNFLVMWSLSQGIISIVGLAGALGTIRKTYVGWALLVAYLGYQTAVVGYSTFVVLATTFHRDHADMFLGPWTILSMAKVVGFVLAFILALLPKTTQPFKAGASFRWLIGVSGWFIFVVIIILGRL